MPLALGLAALASCAPPVVGPPPPGPAPEPALIAGIPPVPYVDGPLAIRVVHPTPATPRPAVASTFVYGSVGTGAATLTINGEPVDVQPNGAFLGFLPVPADGRWELEARAGGAAQRASVQYRTAAPATPGAAAPVTENFAQPRLGTVTGGADTLATGSDVAIGRATPAGAYRWFLPRGARLSVTGLRGDQVRARLGTGVEAWLPAQAVALEASPPAAAAAVTGPVLAAGRDWTDVRLDGRWAPFDVRSEAGRVSVLVYDRQPPATTATTGADRLVRSARWEREPAGARLELGLNGRLWGYKAFYDADGTLVVRLRHAPPIDAARPLRGIRVVVDPGHPPGGATGPTGLTEAEANLNISLPLANLLRARGAEVILTRSEPVAVSLTERVELANATDAHILVSVHNNAFPEGVNPFRRHGTSTYYFHPHAAPLARALQREILQITRIPDLGALSGNLALVRPTWMPAVLTENVFMPLPDQEAALRNRDFTYSLAVAHLRGIEAFLLGTE
jgi:N-acetylmuramoyl-L-alanine amidase